MINMPLSRTGPAQRTNTTHRKHTHRTKPAARPVAHYWKARAKEVNRGTAPSVGRYAASDARRPETLDSPFGLVGILTRSGSTSS